MPSNRPYSSSKSSSRSYSSSNSSRRRSRRSRSRSPEKHKSSSRRSPSSRDRSRGSSLRSERKTSIVSNVPTMKKNDEKIPTALKLKTPSFESELEAAGSSKGCWELPPSSTLIVRGLNYSTKEKKIGDALAQFSPLSIRVILNKVTNESRGFAFVDFLSVEAAQLVVESFKNHTLIIDGRKISLGYSESSRERGGGGNQQQPRPVRCDWYCETCGATNFARRVVCFKCESPKTENSIEIPQSSFTNPSVGSNLGFYDDDEPPNNVLVVRAIPLHVEEEELMQAFSPFAPLKDIRMVRDRMTNTSRGFGFVEFHSIEQASMALDKCNNLMLGGSLVRVCYARDSSTNKFPKTEASNAFAAAALGQAQWSLANGYNASQQLSSSVAADLSALAESNKVNSQPQQPRKKFPLPFEVAGGSYIYESDGTGLYYDTDSMFYYDPQTKYYYNSYHGIYYTFDSTTSKFIAFSPPLPTDDSQPTLTKATPVVKAVTNKKMGLSINLKKKKKTVAGTSGSSGTGISFGIKSSMPLSGKKVANPHHSNTTTSSKQAEIAKWSKVQSDIISSVDDTAKEKNMKSLTSSSSANMRVTTASGQPICMLCRRKFLSVDNLTVHESVSKLHQYHVQRQTLLEKQSNEPVYRDRAKERRTLYGQDDSQKLIRDDEDEDEGEKLGDYGRKRKYMDDPSAHVESKEEKPLDDSNLGSKMLKGMGWQKGRGLGKDGSGIVEPVNLAGGKVTGETTGLGIQTSLENQPQVKKAKTRREKLQLMARARYEAVKD